MYFFTIHKVFGKSNLVKVYDNVISIVVQRSDAQEHEPTQINVLLTWYMASVANRTTHGGENKSK